LAVIDSVRVCHTRPVQAGSLRQVLLARGIDAPQECTALLLKHGLPDFIARDYERIP
jgi:hypothetical protein